MSKLIVAGDPEMQRHYRALKRQLPHVRLTYAEKAIANRAAALAVRAQRALYDATVTARDVSELQRAARVAVQDWDRVVREHQQRQRAQAPSLDEYLNQQGLARSVA